VEGERDRASPALIREVFGEGLPDFSRGEQQGAARATLLMQFFRQDTNGFLAGDFSFAVGGAQT